MNAVITLIYNAILNGAPLMYGTMGEILTERSGNMNLGVEGMMYMGGAFGLAGAFYYGKLAGDGAVGIVALLLAILFSFLAGAIGAAIFGFLTISLRANQNVTGLALTIFGTGVGQFTGEYMRTMEEGGYVAVSNSLKDFFQNSPFPQALQEIPVVGRLVFGHNIFVYLGVIIAIAMGWFIRSTRTGLNLRAIGESPAAADAAGINIGRYKYLATIIGGGISAVGGMVYIMTIAGCVWNHAGLSGEGWLAVALVIFCLWRPGNAIWGSALFGALLIMYLRVHLPIPDEIYKILPYVVTLVVLIFTSLRKKRENQPPESLGAAYFREER